jgi:GntR family transcriptional repressor for pyruvate dehydrogenase complex
MIRSLCSRVRLRRVIGQGHHRGHALAAVIANRSAPKPVGLSGPADSSADPGARTCPGDRLPTAKALAAQFNVATPTLREALRRLQATGVIDIRHGSGIYVRQDRERLMLANPGYGALEDYTVLQVLDARAVIEPHLAALAAAHANSADLAAITQIVEEGAQRLSRDDERYFELNSRFHTAIGRASGNLVLAQIVESLAELYSTELHVIDPDRALEEVRTADHRDHFDILAAIRDRDGERAQVAMRRHLDDVRARLGRRLASEPERTGR